MHMEVRKRIVIYPDNEMDEAYIEKVLGLEKEGDSIKLVRRNAIGLSCIAYLETEATK